VVLEAKNGEQKKDRDDTDENAPELFLHLSDGVDKEWFDANGCQSL